jgi:hypothetical protein
MSLSLVPGPRLYNSRMTFDPSERKADSICTEISITRMRTWKVGGGNVRKNMFPRAHAHIRRLRACIIRWMGVANIFRARIQHPLTLNPGYAPVYRHNEKSASCTLVLWNPLVKKLMPNIPLYTVHIMDPFQELEQRCTLIRNYIHQLHILSELW